LLIKVKFFIIANRIRHRGNINVINSRRNQTVLFIIRC